MQQQAALLCPAVCCILTLQKENSMGKVLFTLVLEERPIRKKTAPPAKAHTNKRVYSRKKKHADHGKHDTIPEYSGIFFCIG